MFKTIFVIILFVVVIIFFARGINSLTKNIDKERASKLTYISANGVEYPIKDCIKLEKSANILYIKYSTGEELSITSNNIIVKYKLPVERE